MYASISAHRLNRDPEPWVYADGTRHASPAPLEWTTDDTGAAVVRLDRDRYAPRPEYTPARRLETNPILDTCRDSWDDDWGSALSWAFACCSVLDYLGEDVPDAYGYRASFAGSADDLADGSYENAEVVSLLGLGSVDDDPDGPVVSLYAPEDVDDDTWAAAGRFAAHAAAVLDRVANAVPESDRY